MNQSFCLQKSALLSHTHTFSLSLAISSVLGFQNKFLQSLFRMDSVICLEHLSSLYYHLGFGFFAFGNFKEMSEIFGLFLLLAFGLKSFYSAWFPTHSAPILSDSTDRSSSVKSKNMLHWKKIVYAKSDTGADGITEKINRKLPKKSIEKICGSQVLALRKLVEMERRRAEAAGAELERERAASATAAEEAMAMIQRLQNEKSSIEMEFNQHRRLAEAKRSHDEEMIQSLEWLIWRHEEEMSLLQEELQLFKSYAPDVAVNLPL
ncbi:hypothetical protein C2S51_022499 [Perilla frutescens var. frutescens]|nr:hypothetical protein C2S51_022499 [Perilla frutescens var. frutescens]